MAQTYAVYILTNFKNSVLYAGVTNSLARRIYEHKNKLVDGFSKRYSLTKLVYYEIFNDPRSAIEREKQIKAGSRKQKIDLIISKNPSFKDLFSDIL